MAAYFAAVVLFGALVAPPLYWAGQHLIRAGIAPWLGRFDFETFFHRALLLGAVIFLWPLLRSIKVRRAADLGLIQNPKWKRDLATGFAIAAGPLLVAAAVILLLHIYTLKAALPAGGMITVAVSAITVPLIEETLFRGLILGILLREFNSIAATIWSSAFFGIVHFLKAPEGTSAMPAWNAGFVSLAHAFDQFRDPILVVAGFTTLFLIGCILAHARIATRSLWIAIGLHSGWILISGEFGKLARRQIVALPWLGKSLLVGFVPLLVALSSWGILLLWLKKNDRRSA